MKKIRRSGALLALFSSIVCAVFAWQGYLTTTATHDSVLADVISHGVLVAVDPDTGQIRAASATEIKNLSAAQQTATQSADPFSVELLPDGTESVYLGTRFMNPYQVQIRVNAQGQKHFYFGHDKLFSEPGSEIR